MTVDRTGPPNERRALVDRLREEIHAATLRQHVERGGDPVARWFATKAQEAAG